MHYGGCEEKCFKYRYEEIRLHTLELLNIRPTIGLKFFGKKNKGTNKTVNFVGAEFHPWQVHRWTFSYISCIQHMPDHNAKYNAIVGKSTRFKSDNRKVAEFHPACA